jgi:hypothetical protein
MAYRGIVAELPLGTQGLTGSKNLTALNPGYLSEATNVSYYDGTLRKEGGATKYNSTAIAGPPTVVGGWDHRTNALAQRMVVACDDGTLLKDTGAGTFATTLKSGLSTGIRPFFCEGGKEAAANDRKLFVFTGTNVVQVLADDNATTADITTPPTDWSGSNQPTFGFIHAFRLCAAGNANDPHRLYYSTTTDHEDFTGAGAGSLAIYPGEGEALVGGLSFNGLAILWKRPKGIYAVDMRDASASNWTVRRITKAVGGISPWGQVETDSDVLFLDSTGVIQSLITTSAFGDVIQQSYSQQVFLDPLLRETLDLGKLNTVRSIYYAAKREVHFAFTSPSGTVNDTRLVIDLFVPQAPRFRLSTLTECEALWLREDSDGIQRVITGDSAGFVWQLDQDTRNVDDAAYASEAKTVPTDLGFVDSSYAHRKKNAEFLELIYAPIDTNTVNVDLEWDGKHVQTVAFHLTTSGTPLGTFVLGTSMLGGSSQNTQRKRLYGGGKFLTLAFRNSVLNADFAIARARLYFTLGAE